MFKRVMRETIKICCQVVLVKMALRCLVRALLHSQYIPSWFDRIATAMSDIIPIDDIEYFKDIFGSRKITVAVSPCEHGVISRLYWRGVASIDKETREIFYERARSASAILDIGANWGYYTLLAGSVASDAKIVAFEPHPFWFKKLEENVSINRLKNIVVEDVAVGRAEGASLFYIDAEHPSASSMVKAYFREGEMPLEIVTKVTSIDEYVSRKSELKKIDLVKIDVETFEGNVLEGMKMVLERDHPDIICEVLPDEDLDYRIANRKTIQNIILGLGYSSYWISDRGLVREDTIKGHFPFSNYLFTKSRVRLVMSTGANTDVLSSTHKSKDI